MTSLEELIKSIPRPSVILVTGRRGSGKDVTAHQIARELHKPIYIDLEPRRYKLPDYYFKWNRDFFNNTTILMHDAHIDLYARQWNTDFNQTMDKLQTISRHKNINIIYTTQMSRRLDVNLVAGVDCLIMKEPSILAEKFERPEMRKLTEEAYRFFQTRKTQQDKWESAVAVTSTGIQYIDYIKKPYYWTEELSRVYASKMPPEPDKPAEIKLKGRFQ